MIQPVTLLSAGVCLWVLVLRYRSTPQNKRKSSLEQKLKTAKILAGALLALLGIMYTMQRMSAKLDGAEHEPTLMERVVLYFSK